MEKQKLVLDTYKKPTNFKWIILAMQHVLAMFSSTVLIPLLVNSAAGEEVITIPVSFITSGVGTLIYILCTKGKSPVYLGTSFAFVTPLIATFTKGGISGAMTGVMLVGIIYIIVSLIVKISGKKWIDKVLPPIIIGPMIMIIGLSLASSAISKLGLSEENIDLKGLIVGLGAFFTTAILLVKGKGVFKVIPFLLGIIVGYILGILLGIVDFSAIPETKFFTIPKFIIPFIHYNPNFSIILTILPVAIVTIAEHIGDHSTLSHIIGKDLLKDPGLEKTLLGDGLATFFAGLIGGPVNTTFSQNTALVGMTKVASVWVTGLAAIIVIILGFLGKFTAILSGIPIQAIGGISLVLFGFIATNGIRVLIDNKVDFENPKNIIILSTMLILGIGGATISVKVGEIIVNISGISLSAMVGIILNIILPQEIKEK